MRYQRMIMEVESPEEIGYEQVRFNLAESSMTDRTLDELGVDLAGLTLCYGHHRGHPDLRALIASDGPGVLTADDVLVAPGAAGALFIVATTVLGPGDHLIVAHPNYASNFETPRAIGCDISYLDLRFEEGWRLDLDRLAALVQPNTKLISLTSPHNPTGVVLSPSEIAGAIEIAERAGAWLLLDETYRELSDCVSPPAAVLSDRVISVSSISKTYGAPGLRIGWIINRDPALMTECLAAKEQIVLAPSVVDEAIASQLLRQRDALLPGILAHARANRSIMTDWIANESRLEWVPPVAGVVSFPRIKPGLGIDPAAFHRRLNTQFKTWAGPGHWFEQPAEFMRIGYGYPTTPDLRTALANVSEALTTRD